MRAFFRFVADFSKREDGPTAAQYAVVLGLIVMFCIGTIKTLGTNVNGRFNSQANDLSPASSSS